MGFRAIIWDCDGVLIDSEVLACQIVAGRYTEVGFPLTATEYILKFAGQSREQIAEIIRQEMGEDLAASIDWELAEADREALFEAKLQRMPGIDSLVAHAAARNIPMAVASGSSLKRLEHSLKLVDLWNRFYPHIYSTEQVARGKPSPEIYLLAAEKLAVLPAACLVIEDSEHGIRAGKAAGMTVYGLSAASHCTSEWARNLRAAGADDVFSSVGDLFAAVEKLFRG